MKLPKIVLTVVAIATVAGAALAFKARSSETVYTRSNPLVNVCDVPVQAAATTNTFTTITVHPATFATTIENDPCPLVKNIYGGL